MVGPEFFVTLHIKNPSRDEHSGWKNWLCWSRESTWRRKRLVSRDSESFPEVETRIWPHHRSFYFWTDRRASWPRRNVTSFLCSLSRRWWSMRRRVSCVSLELLPVLPVDPLLSSAERLHQCPTVSGRVSLRVAVLASNSNSPSANFAIVVPFLLDRRFDGIQSSS